MSRLLIISNRLPFSVDRSGEDLLVRQSSGGLVSAIKSYFESPEAADSSFSEKIWIGTFDAPEEDWNILKEMGAVPSDFGIEPVFAPKDVYDNFYNGFSNSTVWPLFHYFPSLVDYKKEYFDAYMHINRLFADKILSIYQPGDTIWVHDYQLMVLPQMLRDAVSDATIGFFLHIPFPSYEIFRLMPTEWKRAILLGMLGSDLIGFHTHDYVQHFIHSVKMALKVESQYNTIYYNSRIIRSDLFPIGIDYKKFRDARNDEMVINICNNLKERFEGKKIVFSVDRLDYTKGVNYRLEGFEKFLEENEEWSEKVVFMLNVIPSRDVIPTYIDRKRMIEEKVSNINGRFSTLDWQPIIYRYNHLSFDELCALYQVADVALITPLRDGMNLVAKEYIASCVDKGVLILSELTGAANELSEALMVNPTDTTEVVNALTAALSMPLPEQHARFLHMQKRIADYDVLRWINDFLEQLVNAKKEQDRQKVNILDTTTIQKMIADFGKAQKRCILLDYDGTLAPYQKLPSLATPSNDLINLLSELASEPANEIVVISGRDADTLEKWLGDLPINLVAEHGACIRYRNEVWQLQATQSPAWKEEIRPILELFVNRCPGSFIEEKKNTLAWHYRNTNPDLGFTRSRELRNSLLQLTTNTPLQVIDGNKVIEVRLIGMDKGATAINLVGHFKPDFILCIGDDTTDEDMFRVLRDDGYTIKIGSGNTAALYTLWSQKDVLPLLRKFIAPVQKQSYGYSQV